VLAPGAPTAAITTICGQLIGALGKQTRGRATSSTTALGYNQLLATNTIEIVAESGARFIAGLLARIATLPEPEKSALESKIATVRKMVAFARSVPDDWNQHEVLANTPKGLGVHALNLDVDFGPYLQTQKLMDSVVFARRKGTMARSLRPNWK